jgi:glycosyltransferase-like protein
MRIALLSYSTRPRGGVVHTLALAEALAAQGEDVTVWSLGRGGDSTFFRPVGTGVQVRLVPFPELADETVGERILRSIDVLADAFEPHAYDVVHAQDCISANAVTRAGGTCIRTVHHLDSFSTPELAACHERAVVEPVAHVCVSGSVATELLDGWGITAAVIANGVDAARFEKAAGDDEEARSGRERWRASYAPYLLTVGGIEPRKGSIDLLEAYALARESVPDLRLVVAGGETLFDYRDYRAQWERQADRLGVDPVQLGVVPDAVLPSLVAAASVFAFPSTKEGFGLAPMEALAAGVPLVVRDLPVLREVFGATAELATGVSELAAGIINALEAPDRARVHAGIELARRHTWQAAATAHRQLYGARMDGSRTGEDAAGVK